MDLGKGGGYTHPVLLFWPGHSKLYAKGQNSIPSQARTVARDGYRHRLCLCPLLFRYVLNR